MKKVLSLLFSVILFASFAQAQTAEVGVFLNEKFFEALLDTLLKGNNPPEFSLTQMSNNSGESQGCRESIRLQREVSGTKTAVQLRDGQIFAPLAFTGSYNPPLVGCLNFSGVAETKIDLEFDQTRQALVGRASVLNVNLSGTNGMGGSVLTRLVQNVIDQRINPIEILKMDKVSFTVPVQNSGSLQMKAVGMRHQVNNGSLNVYITYRFE